MQIKNILMLKFKKIPKEILYLAIAFLCIIVIGVAAQTITKATMGKQDMYLEGSGTTTAHTFTRTTNSGYSITLNKVDWPGVDVLMVYGGGVNRTSATLNSAITGWGTATDVKFWIAPGSWTISADVSFPENVTVEMANGATFAIATGKTVTLNAPANLIAQYNQAIVSGVTTGLTFTYDDGIKSNRWADGLGVATTLTLNDYVVVSSISMTAGSATDLTVTASTIDDLTTSRVTFTAGTATAGYGPLKFTDGSLLTVIEDGTVEFMTPVMYFTAGSERHTFPGVSSGTTTPATIPIRVGDIFVDATNSKVYISKATTASTDWLLLN